MAPLGERLPRLAVDDLDEHQRKLYEGIVGGDRGKQTQHFPLTDENGSLNGPFGVMLHAPAVGDSLQGLGAAIRFHTNLSARIREVAILQTAHACGSAFEWWAHVRVGRAVGLTDEEITQLSVGCFDSADAEESAAAALCRCLLSSSTVSDPEFAAAREALDHRQIVELTTLVGYYRTLAQLMTVFDVGIPAGGAGA